VIVQENDEKLKLLEWRFGRVYWWIAAGTVHSRCNADRMAQRGVWERSWGYERGRSIRRLCDGGCSPVEHPWQPRSVASRIVQTDPYAPAISARGV
jgi:hypothetical protein